MLKYARALILGDIHGSLKYLSRIREILNSYEYIFVLGDLSFDRNHRFFIRIIDELFGSLKNTVFIVRGENDPEVFLDEIREGIIFEKTYINNNLGVIMIPPLISYDLKIPLETEIAKLEHNICNVCNRVKTSILITHIPPHGLKIDYDPVRGHMGSYTLRRIIEKCRPTLTLCAHVHEGRNIVKHGKTIIVNPGPLRRGFYGELYMKIIDDELELFSVVLNRF